MASSLLRRNLYIVVLVGCFLLILLTACGSDTSSATISSSSNSASNSHTASPATTTATALNSLMVLVGQPKAKMLQGTTFEVDGMLKNGDSKQHDIYLQVKLFDASGKQTGSAIENVDNVAGGATVNYAIQGTTSQPTWAKVEVTVQKVTENIGGSGTD